MTGWRAPIANVARGGAQVREKTCGTALAEAAGVKLNPETMAPRGRRRLAWMLGALLVGLGSGASLATSIVPGPDVCDAETLQVTVARTAFAAWLGSGTAFRNDDTIRRIRRTRRGVAIELVRNGCPVTMAVEAI